MLRFINAATEKLGRAVSLIALLVMLLIGMDVILRYSFNSPTIWGWPVNQQLFGVLSLFGGVYAFLHNRHIRVEVLYERFGPKMKLVSFWLTVLCFVIFLGVLLWQGCRMAITSAIGSEFLSGPFKLPLYPLKILIPLVVLLFLVQGIATFLRSKKL